MAEAAKKENTEKKEFKFPTEIIDLPSEGKVYPKDSPLSGGKIEIKYMTAKEEDILTSQNLIEKGLVVDKLLDSLIVTKGINTDDLILGDKNALMVAARILAYGSEYTAEITNPKTGNTFDYTFNLAECPFKRIEGEVSSNEFDVKLPVSKATVTFRLLTGVDEKNIEKEIKSVKKAGLLPPELTTRLKHSIISIDGEDDRGVISKFVDNMLSRDSLHLRSKINELTPDIDMEQEIEIGGDTVTVTIPMTVNFFWPKS
jgi:hypothetical protein